MSTPVGEPDASRMSRPPAGSGVSRATPPASRAGRFASAAWPSIRVRNTGFRGAATSSGPGCRPLIDRPPVLIPPSAEHPLARTHRGRPRPHASPRSPRRSAYRAGPAPRAGLPRPSTCPCASCRPGTTLAPPASMTSVDGPSIEARRPTFPPRRIVLLRDSEGLGDRVRLGRVCRPTRGAGSGPAGARRGGHRAAATRTARAHEGSSAVRSAPVGSHMPPAGAPAQNGLPSLLLRRRGACLRGDCRPVQDRVEQQLERAERLRAILHAEGVQDALVRAPSGCPARRPRHAAAVSPTIQPLMRSGPCGYRATVAMPGAGRGSRLRSRRCSRTWPPQPAACRSRWDAPCRPPHAGASLGRRTLRGRRSRSRCSPGHAELLDRELRRVAERDDRAAAVHEPRSAATPSSPRPPLCWGITFGPCSPRSSSGTGSLGQQQHVEAAARMTGRAHRPGARACTAARAARAPSVSSRRRSHRPTARTTRRAAGGGASGARQLGTASSPRCRGRARRRARRPAPPTRGGPRSRPSRTGGCDRCTGSVAHATSAPDASSRWVAVAAAFGSWGMTQVVPVPVTRPAGPRRVAVHAPERGARTGPAPR